MNLDRFIIYFGYATIILVLLMSLVSCDRGLSEVNIINWKNMQEGPQKEACRRCSIDAHVKDCNECAGRK